METFRSWLPVLRLTFSLSCTSCAQRLVLPSLRFSDIHARCRPETAPAYLLGVPAVRLSLAWFPLLLVTRNSPSLSGSSLIFHPARKEPPTLVSLLTACRAST